LASLGAIIDPIQPFTALATPGPLADALLSEISIPTVVESSVHMFASINRVKAIVLLLDS